MSEALYGVGGLRFWTEAEIQIRDQAIQSLQLALSSALKGQNSAWNFIRVEGPLLTPRNHVSPAYDESDIFLCEAKFGDQQAVLRAETTASSYLYAQHLLKQEGAPKFPLCIWQVGKSFRRETNDGARASDLRYNEFYQIEFQCIYKDNTKADIRSVAEAAIRQAIAEITMSFTSRIVPSDRLPDYSMLTNDVEILYDHGSTKMDNWKEMASISTRTDFPVEGTLVLEVAVGLDRLVAVAMNNRAKISEFYDDRLIK